MDSETPHKKPTPPAKSCHACRDNFVRGNLAFAVGDGKAYCKKCWDILHHRTEIPLSLELILLQWARHNLRPAFDAIAQPSTDRQWWDKCLAAIFRAWADNRSEDWIDAVLVTFTADVRRLAPLIVRAGGWRFSPQWIDARLALAGVAVAAQVVRELKPSIQREDPVGIF